MENRIGAHDEDARHIPIPGIFGSPLVRSNRKAIHWPKKCREVIRIPSVLVLIFSQRNLLHITRRPKRSLSFKEKNILGNGKSLRCHLAADYDDWLVRRYRFYKQGAHAYN